MIRPGAGKEDDGTTTIDKVNNSLANIGKATNMHRQANIGPNGMTLRQTKFVQALLDGMNQSDAYRASHNIENMQDSSIRVEASRLMRNPKIQTTLMQARHEAGRMLKITVETLSDMALETFNVALNAGKTSDMNASIQTLAKLNGLMVERSERKVETFKRGDREALEAEVRRLCSSLGIKVLDAVPDDAGVHNVVDVQDDSTQ